MMKSWTLLLMLIGVLGCSTVPTSSVPLPTETTSPALPTGSALANLDRIATSSSCAAVKWKDRGKMPAGFLKGVALSYQRALCNYRSPKVTASGVIGKTLGDTEHDALAHYGLGSGANGEERLTITYALLLGLGMRESSGKYLEGYDKSAGIEKASEAEAGAWQFSFNSIGANPALSSLYREYQAKPERCLSEVFQEGAQDPRQSVVGTGEGAVFQTFTKSCPAFQAEYAAVLIRVLGGSKGHFGPLRRKEAEFIPACFEMLGQVAQATKCE